MAERLSALASLAPSGQPEGIALTDAGYRSVVQVQAWPDTLKTVQAVIMQELLVEDLPAVGSAVRRNDSVLAAISPGRFVLAGPADLATRIEGALPASDAAVADLSHGRVIFTIEGAAAERTLQSCVMIDVSLGAFRIGRAAQTMIHHIDVMIHRVGEDRFDVWVLRSFAQSVAEWILDAAEGTPDR